ncbi:MAG: hypothetical protein M1833_003838 [Piccolia ochrophora]|nr:MAG: hypothetical protein M1833_003838 [Piccolia ochrophora]
MFGAFRDALDEHHDRRERVIKASRDITALSKKIIFSLQRVRQSDEGIPENVAKENRARARSIEDLFDSISPDLQGLNIWRYQRQVSNGVQEFIEAVSFQYYLEKEALISLREAADRMPHQVQLTTEDYILGVSDLTGELMRFAITTMASRGSISTDPPVKTDASDRVGPIDRKPSILIDLQSMRTYYESLDGASPSLLRSGFEKKLEVMGASVDKVEASAYNMMIRGCERPKGWVPHVDGH